MVTRKLSELKPHPINAQIYGEPIHMTDPEKDEFDELVKSIKEKGLLNPITIDQDDIILDGHRRFFACGVLGAENIKTRQFTFTSQYQRIDYLLEQNLYRAKTKMQKVREGLFREANVAEKAKKKMLHIEEKDENTVSVVTRNAVGKMVGLSGTSFADGKKVVEKIDSLREDGKKDEADKLEEKANASISGAANEIKIKKKPKKERDDPDFWYITELAALISTMENKASRMSAKSKSTTPAALSWFFNNIQNEAKMYRTWLKDNMHDCPICKGTMFLVSGDSCRNCISGKVGVYEIPDVEIAEET